MNGRKQPKKRLHPWSTSPSNSRGLQKKFDRQAELEEIWARREVEARPLLDDLARFGLEFEHINQLDSAEDNAFAIAITRMVDYIDIFEDDQLQFALALALSRPEGKGFVAKPMMKRFARLESKKLDARFQAAKAIAATAQKEDVEQIETFILDPNVHVSSRRVFLSAIASLDRDRLVPLLRKCLHMDDETIIEALERLRRYKKLPNDILTDVAALSGHANSEVRLLADRVSL